MNIVEAGEKMLAEAAVKHAELHRLRTWDRLQPTLYRGKLKRGDDDVQVIVTSESNGYAIFVCGSKRVILHKYLFDRDEAIELAAYSVAEKKKGYGWCLDGDIAESCRDEEK